MPPSQPLSIAIRPGPWSSRHPSPRMVFRCGIVFGCASMSPARQRRIERSMVSQITSCKRGGGERTKGLAVGLLEVHQALLVA